MRIVATKLLSASSENIASRGQCEVKLVLFVRKCSFPVLLEAHWLAIDYFPFACAFYQEFIIDSIIVSWFYL